MINPGHPRRAMIGVAKRWLLDGRSDDEPSEGELPRLTSRALESTRMSRSRERILSNLDDMYREAFERAKATGDDGQMTTLDFAYRREQLYFEILLDIRDAVTRR
jgi:hypothetical protein